MSEIRKTEASKTMLVCIGNFRLFSDVLIFRFQRETVERKLRNLGTIGRPSSVDGMLDLMAKNANIGHLR